jgi:hypothetical protein
MKAHMPADTLKGRFLFEPDRFLQRLYFPVVVLLVLFTSVHYLRVAYLQAMGWSGWSIGEWLTNLEAGWVRRGLGGQVILLLSDATSIPMNWIVLTIQGVAYLAFVALFLNLLHKKVITFWYFVACFAPSFLLFTYYDSMAVGRKEVLLYLMFIIWLRLCMMGQNTSSATLIFSAIYFILTLVHETFFFYSLYFVLAAVLCRDNIHSKSLLPFLIPFVSFLGVVLTALTSGPMNGPGICDSLLARGLPPSVCSGPINFGVPSSGVLLRQYVSSFDLASLAQIGWVFLIVISPAYLVFRSVNLSRSQRQQSVWILVGLVCFSAPLFMLATDWGRWISMHCTMAIVLLITVLPNRTLGAVATSIASPANTPGGTMHSITNLLIATILFLSLNASYSLSHCCDKNFLTWLGPVDRLLAIRIFSN